MANQQKQEIDLTQKFDIISSTNNGQSTPKMVQTQITDWMMSKMDNLNE